MSNFKCKGDKTKYYFVDRDCIGRKCWAPGMYQHRGATMSGSRNTGDETPCCLNRAYYGCPRGPVGEETRTDGNGGIYIVCGLPETSKELTTKRKAEGWKAV